MWPFSRNQPEEPDTRPPSVAAKAIAESLANEPLRWRIDNLLMFHDSGISINTDRNDINHPWVPDEPDANEEVIASGVDAWIAARLKCPAEEPKPAQPTE